MPAALGTPWAVMQASETTQHSSEMMVPRDAGLVPPSCRLHEVDQRDSPLRLCAGCTPKGRAAQ